MFVHSYTEQIKPSYMISTSEFLKLEVVNNSAGDFVITRVRIPTVS